MQNRKDVGQKILSIGSSTFYVRNVKKAAHAPIQVVEVKKERWLNAYTFRAHSRATRVLKPRFADFFEAVQYLLHYIPVPQNA